MKKILGVVMTLVLVAVLAVPYVLGGQVKGQYVQRVTRMSQAADIDAKVVSYKRGWLRSHARVRVTDSDLTFDLDSDIHHAVLPGFDYAHIVTTLDADQVPGLSDLFNGPVLTMDSRVGLDKAVKTHITSPRATGTVDLEDTPVSIDWGGMDGQYDSHNGESTLTLTFDKLRAYNDNFRARIDNVELSGTTTDDDHYDDPMLQSMLGTSDGRLQIGRVNMADPEGTAVAFSLEVKSASKDADDTLGYELSVAARDIDIDDDQGGGMSDLNLDSVALQFDARGFKREALADLLVDVRDLDDEPLAADGTTPMIGARLRKRLERHVDALLTDDARVSLRVPAIQTNHGATGLAVSFGMGSRMLGDRSLPMPARLAQRLSVQLSAFVDRSLLEYGVENTPDSGEFVQMFNELLQNNLISVNDEQFKSAAHYNDGSLRINGQRVPPQLMQAFIGGFNEGRQQ